METSSLQEILSATIAGQPFIQAMADLAIKSSIIIALTAIIARAFKKKLSVNANHLLWVNSLLCIALLPILGSFIVGLSASMSGQEIIGFITVHNGMSESVETVAISSDTIVFALYSLVAATLLLRLAYSALSLRRINRDAEILRSGSLVLKMNAIHSQAQLRRAVILKVSKDIDSPMSFGLFRPVIIVPGGAMDWGSSVQEDVLLHELSHIKRLDWPVMLFCNLLCSVLWINPFVWLAKKRVNESAEQACDAAVLDFGKDQFEYAEDLLRLARDQKRSRSLILAQLMFDESCLVGRVKSILNGNRTVRISKKYLSSMAAYVLVFMVTLSNVSLFKVSVAAEDSEYVPLSATAPLYPTVAAEEGIEGWVLVGFTVLADGSVDGNSVQVIDAEPEGIFDNNSIRAASKFVFGPRVVDGVAVDVPGVQYLFKYVLEDGGTLDDLDRQPPPPRQ